jgi:hypothetical protein
MSISSTELERIEQLIKKGESVLATRRPPPSNVTGFDRIDSTLFSEWKSQSQSFIIRLVGQDHVYSKAFKNEVDRALVSSTKRGIGILKAIKDDLVSGNLDLDLKEPVDVALCVENICNNFHRIARQLRARYNNRDTLNVKDEYDVQDLLHAILCLYFDDIRPEESTPSYAGGSSRLDFLLKKEQLVIEVKRSREKLTAKELANQLIEDIDRYKAHPDCKILMCFVYDPEGNIPNPRGIEADLSRDNGPFPVRVMIRP